MIPRLIVACALLSSCSQAVQSACSPEALEANVVLCKIALGEAKARGDEALYQTTQLACLAMIDRWEACE